MKAPLLLGLVLVVLSACSSSPCPDCCPPGPTTTPVQVGCRLLQPDGGALSGVAARCQRSDAGALTDGTGAFSFTASQLTCGIAAGNNDCGEVSLISDGGALTVTDPSQDAGATSVYSGLLTGGSCVLIAR